MLHPPGSAAAFFIFHPISFSLDNPSFFNSLGRGSQFILHPSGTTLFVSGHIRLIQVLTLELAYFSTSIVIHHHV